MAGKQGTVTTRKIKSLVGEKFGRLTVVEFAGRKGSHTCSTWRCLCDCGKERIVRGDCLKGGVTKSCGCLARERSSARIIKLATKHGKSGTAEYLAWLNMVKRCGDRKTPYFKNYGGRGIAVCDDWKNSFETFLRDMGTRPSGKYSLDRIDNNGNYEPSNCRWSTKVEQQTNMRSNRVFSLNGETHHAAEWCRIFAMNDGTFSHLVTQAKNPEQALERLAQRRQRVSVG